MGDSKISLQFLKELFSSIDSNINVESFEETIGSGRGDNYTASLFRIEVKGTREKLLWTTSIICKCLPESQARREAFKSDKLFRNEIAFYTKVVPLFQKFQESKIDLIEKPFNAIPKCLYAKNDLIILEDLKTQNFEMADRKQGLNVEQISTVLVELSKFHALSMAIKITRRDDFDDLFDEENGISEALFCHENKEWYRDYYKMAIQNVLDMIKRKLPKNELKEMYIGKFSNFADDQFFQKMINLTSNTENLSVLCHGDCWTNNMLFKTSDTQGLEVCFIDFQLCRHGSLALDLANLIYCCTTRQLRDNHITSLLTIYRTNFSKTLKALLQNTNHENHILTNDDYFHKLFIAEFRRCSLFGLGLAIDIIPLSTCNSEEAPDMYDNETNEDTELVPVHSTNELCSTKMVNLIRELTDNGLL